MVLGIAAVLVVAGYTGYLYWAKSSSEAELKMIEKTLSDYEGKVLQYDNQNLVQAINAKETLNKIKEETIEWSKVIRTIRKTIPRDNGEFLVDVLSYSGSTDKSISMNIKTVQTAEKPYFDVADLIQAFDESKEFSEAFVPSISVGIDKKGNKILSFVLSVKYLGEALVEPVLEESEAKSTEALDATVGEIIEGAVGSDEGVVEEVSEGASEGVSEEVNVEPVKR